jgi:hypothetical protein
MKTKWKYLRNALLGNLVLFAVAWWTLADMFILKHNESIFFIAFFIYGIKSIDDAKVDELKDKVEELEKQKHFNDKYKLL